MTTADKTGSELARMVAEVSNRRNAPGTVAATAKAAPAEPTLSGSVEQAREIVAAHVAVLRETIVRLEAEAARLEYALDLVFSVYVAGPKPVNVDDARKRAEAEADARQAAKRAADRHPASEEAIAEMMAAAPPVINPMDVEAVGERLTPLVIPLTIGWSCPDHGKVVVKTSQRTGREYKACPQEGCIEIERRA